MAEELDSDFYISGWHIQPGLNRIVKGSITYSIEHRVMRVLVCLATHAPEPVTREQLLKVAWPDLYTSEHSLTTVISELRKVFDDDPRRPQLIETIRKIGYRLMVPPVELPKEPVVIERPLPPPAKGKLTLRSFWPAGIALLLLSAWLFTRKTAPTASLQFTSAPVPLTTYPAGEFDPDLAPNQNAIAFVWTGKDKNFDIYLKDLDGETPRRLTKTPGFDGSPVWSPDGQRIAYMSSGDGACGIFITSVTGGDRKRVADCGYHDESALDWSPDGRFLVFSDRPGGVLPSCLKLLDLETSQVQILTQPNQDLTGDRDPVFSPDGTMIAFVRGTVMSTEAHEISPVFGDLYTFNLKTKTLTQVTHENVEIPGFTWTPDGQSFLYSSNRDGLGYGLWLIGFQGGSSKAVLRGKDLVRNPILNAKGTQIIYEDWERDTNIWRLALNHSANSKPHLFIESTRWESNPQYSPNGKRIAFASKRSGHTEIWISDAEGNQPQRLTQFEGPYVNVPRWSPDGSKLCFEVREKGQAHIFTIDVLAPQTYTQVTRGTSYNMAANWSQDGQHLYFGSNRSGRWQLWKQALAGGTAKQITTNGGFFAIEFGDSLFFTQLHRSGIWQMPMNGGTAKVIIERMFSQDWDNWDLRQEGIYFVTRQRLRTAALCFFPFPAGPVQKLLEFDSHRVLGKNGLSVSPNGEYVLFTKLDRLTGDLMLVEGLPSTQ